MSGPPAVSTTLPLPAAWPAIVKTALLQVIGLARYALLDVGAGFASGPRDARLALRIAALELEVSQLREELRIKDGRMARLEARKRPHFAGEDRLAILQLRAARGWTSAETARRFMITVVTLGSWFARRDEGGDSALVRTAVPVNRFPDHVGEVVRAIRTSFPVLGTQRIVDMLARMGLHLGEATVRRLAKARSRGEPPAGPSGRAPPGESSTRPRVTASHAHHVWHVDLTFVQTGLCVPWIPFTLPQRWPFGWWVGAVLDHHSRAILGSRVWKRSPRAAAVLGLLRDAVQAAGRPPRHIISDRGCQFREAYVAWCCTLGVRPRFGAVHRHGSIAMIERFWRSMKQECFRRIAVPLGVSAMRAELDAYLRWYHSERPHQALGGRTPAELLSGERPARDRRRVEPRPSMPIPRNRNPRLKPRRVRGSLQLHVVRELGTAKLPVLELRQVA